MDITERELKYLGLLSKQFPNAATAASEIINLQAILNLPKGTSPTSMASTKHSSMC